jgi:hypothetical protein
MIALDFAHEAPAWRNRSAIGDPGRTRAPSIAALSAAGAILLGAAHGVAAANAGGAFCFFAEPLTGRRVDSYTVELATGREEHSSFAVPGECDAVLQAANQGSAYTGSVVDRRLWQKVESDCRYYSFLNHHPLEDMQDHVSNYDFRNARLSDLPIDQRCAHDGSGGDATDCNPAATDRFGLLRNFPITEPPHHATDAHEKEDCQLRDGVFRGRLYVDTDGVHCEPGTGAPSLRLVAVDFADVNGDQVLDAVLRFIPIGPGASRIPLTLPVTRFSDSGPFTTPVFDAPPPLPIR